MTSMPLAVVLVIVGVAAVVGSAAVVKRGVSEGEERLFRAANRAPDAWFVPVFVSMQFGTYGTTPVLASITWLSGSRGEAVAILLAGTAAWLLAKVVKRLAERGRPQQALEAEVVLRGPNEGGSGFPSGHAATSTVLAIVLGATLGGWWWSVLIALALMTWFGRMYLGVHLPLDIAGGIGIGSAVAGLALLITRLI